MKKIDNLPSAATHQAEFGERVQFQIGPSQYEVYEELGRLYVYKTGRPGSSELAVYPVVSNIIRVD